MGVLPYYALLTNSFLSWQASLKGRSFVFGRVPSSPPSVTLIAYNGKHEVRLRDLLARLSAELARFNRVNLRHPVTPDTHDPAEILTTSTDRCPCGKRGPPRGHQQTWESRFWLSTQFELYGTFGGLCYRATYLLGTVGHLVGTNWKAAKDLVEPPAVTDRRELSIRKSSIRRVVSAVGGFNGQYISVGRNYSTSVDSIKKVPLE
jgi:hypothetical protein